MSPYKMIAFVADILQLLCDCQYCCACKKSRTNFGVIFVEYGGHPLLEVE
jgi:hypothetical protein